METEQGNMKLPISLIKETGDLKKITEHQRWRDGRCEGSGVGKDSGVDGGERGREGVQAYLAGLTFALAASPCSTLVLASILGSSYWRQSTSNIHNLYIAPLLLLAVSFAGALQEILAILSMILGNLIAITQISMKRMLAYSSISQIEYVIIENALLSSRFLQLH
ncbi:hypothetical protein Syun_028412 [Stephania yunnanensis]|uniref:NADH:quinone oxidoreductase/Mrp antiporter transmembrane domain-containing protein n=1 Tax=Stephania yunnanensis TaxID=152371 RepID=A0AAP0EHB2_9MAGN